MMENMDEKTDILLARYFSGEATGEELQALDEWLAQSPGNETYFEEMTMVFQYAGSAKAMPQPDVEKALAGFKNYCNESVKARKHEGVKVQKEEGNMVRFPFAPSRLRAFVPHISIAASVLLIVGLSLLLFKKGDNRTLFATDETVQKELFEGVFVTLSAGTEIAYNPQNQREVTLKRGEATFAVNSQESGQLLVQVGDVFVEDIGTVFTVIAHQPKDSILVEVTEGEVFFFSENKDGINIKESGKGVFYPQKNVFEHIAPLAEIKAIEFDATPLSEVIQVLSLQYNTEIKTAADSLNKLQISVSFDPNDSIEDILTVISETLSMRVIKNTDGVFVFSY